MLINLKKNKSNRGDSTAALSILLIKQNPTRVSFKVSILTCSLSTSSVNQDRTISLSFHLLCSPDRTNACAIQSCSRKYSHQTLGSSSEFWLLQMRVLPLAVTAYGVTIIHSHLSLLTDLGALLPNLTVSSTFQLSSILVSKSLILHAPIFS
jgi:hypothetical protein